MFQISKFVFSRYQKKHSPTHHPDHHPIFISFFHLPRSIASSLFKLRAWQSFCYKYEIILVVCTCTLVSLYFLFLGPPFVKRFALCYRTVVLSFCLSVTLVHCHCGQTVGWLKMKLSTEVDLGPGHIVLHWDSALPHGAQPPIFGPGVVAKRLDGSRIKMPLGMEVGVDQGQIVLDGDTAPPPKKRAQQPPLFGPSVMAKRLDGSRCHLVRR